MIRTINILFTFLLGLLNLSVHASEPVMESDKVVHCVVLEKFEGDVQILNETRDQMIKTHIGAQIPCGGWVSVSSGWVKVKHKSNYVIKTGSETLFEVFDNLKGIHTSSEDHVVLLRGSLFIESNRKEELRIATANSRVRMVSGRVVINYDRESDETQLFSITDHASLENRFETSRRVELKRGEITGMNFQENRVVPSAPKAADITSLKQNLNRLPLSTKEYKSVLRLAKAREKRRLPKDLNKTAADRKVASETKKEDQHSYTMSPSEKKAYVEWKKKLIGGIDDMRIFFPDEEAQRRISRDESKFTPKRAKPKKKIDSKKLMEEKKRLIEDLKGVHVE